MRIYNGRESALLSRYGSPRVQQITYILPLRLAIALVSQWLFPLITDLLELGKGR